MVASGILVNTDTTFGAGLCHGYQRLDGGVFLLLSALSRGREIFFARLVLMERNVAGYAVADVTQLTNKDVFIVFSKEGSCMLRQYVNFTADNREVHAPRAVSIRTGVKLFVLLHAAFSCLVYVPGESVSCHSTYNRKSYYSLAIRATLRQFPGLSLFKLLHTLWTADRTIAFAAKFGL